MNIREFRPAEGWKRFNEMADKMIEEGRLTLSEAIGYTLCIVALPFIICLFAV